MAYRLNRNPVIKRLSASVDAVTTTFTSIADLTFDVKAGMSYGIHVVINTGTIPDSGIKITIDGTATATTFFTAGDGNVVSTLGSDIISRAISGVDIAYIIEAFIIVDAAGTLGLQFAQVDADGGTTTLSVGTFVTLTPIIP